jgi:hypothetical protein
MVVGTSGRRASSLHGRQVAERERQEGVRDKNALPMTYFLQPYFTS